MGTGSGQWPGRVEPAGTIGIAGTAAQAEGLVSQAQQRSLSSSSGPQWEGWATRDVAGPPQPRRAGFQQRDTGCGRPAQGSRPRFPASSPPPPPGPFFHPRKFRGARGLQFRLKCKRQRRPRERPAHERAGDTGAAGRPLPPPHPSRPKGAPPDLRGGVLENRELDPALVLVAGAQTSLGREEGKKPGDMEQPRRRLGASSLPGRPGLESPLGPETSFDGTLETGLGDRRQGGPGRSPPAGGGSGGAAPGLGPPGTSAGVGLQMCCTWLGPGSKQRHAAAERCRERPSGEGSSEPSSPPTGSRPPGGPVKVLAVPGSVSPSEATVSRG